MLLCFALFHQIHGFKKIHTELTMHKVGKFRFKTKISNQADCILADSMNSALKYIKFVCFLRSLFYLYVYMFDEFPSPQADTRIRRIGEEPKKTETMRTNRKTVKNANYNTIY